jgi:hypothetical protein
MRSKDVSAAITGGLATRAYTGPVRFTHDIDMVVSAPDCGKIKRILKDMGYKGSRKPFGRGEILFATKHHEDKRKGIAYTLKIDVSVGGIYDHSSGILYPVSDRLFHEARNMEIRGYFPTSSSIYIVAQVLGLEDLFLLKAMTVPNAKNGREKDTIDALLLALKNPPDPVKLWALAKEAGIQGHIRGSVEGKLIPYITEAEHPLMDRYGLTLDRIGQDMIMGRLSAILSHYPY